MEPSVKAAIELLGYMVVVKVRAEGRVTAIAFSRLHWQLDRKVEGKTEAEALERLLSLVRESGARPTPIPLAVPLAERMEFREGSVRG
jgi:hypothetical protein